MKICTMCLEEKDESAFRLNKKKHWISLRARCRKCEYILQTQYRKTAAGKLNQKRQDLKKLYGISLEDYEVMLKSQNNVCLICKQEESSKSNSSDSKRMLCVDHDHNTGEIRGLLCNNCNKLLGHARDNVEILQTAIRYLKFYSTSKSRA